MGEGGFKKNKLKSEVATDDSFSFREVLTDF
jgi:hypothetical protein